MEEQKKFPPLIESKWSSVLSEEDKKPICELLMDCIAKATIQGCDASTIAQALHIFVEDTLYDYELNT